MESNFAAFQGIHIVFYAYKRRSKAKTTDYVKIFISFPGCNPE
jgi:hypothetical protein